MIEVGDSIAKVKLEINTILADVGVAPAVSWGDAHTKLNLLGAGLTANMGGEEAREKINALFDGPTWVPEGVDLYVDFQNNRYYDGWIRALDQYVTDTHATDILSLGSTGYETFAPNVLPRTDLGLLTTVGWTNKCENFNANPTDLTGVFLVSSPAEATLSLVDDADALVASGFGGLIASGKMNAKVYRLDNSLGASTAQASITGGVGNLNPHTVTAYARGSGGLARTRLSTVTDGSAYTTLTATYQRLRVTLTPLSTFETTRVQVEPGVICYFILNQLEEGPFATDPIITEGSAVTRPGNMPTIDLAGRLGEGVAGVIAVDILQPAPSSGFPRILEFNDGGSTNCVSLVHSGGNLNFGMVSGGVSQGEFTVAPWTSGRKFIAFAASENFIAARAVGGSQGTDTVASMALGLDTLCVGTIGFTSSFNTYQRTERLALKFGPQDQTSFDAMYELAQEWAA